VNAALLRALVGAQDQLRAAFTAVDDDPALRARVREIGQEVGELILGAVKDRCTTPTVAAEATS
jgi:hypothetical protein